jgi:pyruvyltransferase
MSLPIPLFFSRADTHPNLGDDLSPYIVNKLSGRAVSIVSKEHPNSLLAIGSILELGVFPTQTVWGSGFIKYGKFRVASKVFCVRGPLSLNILDSATCIPVGDPALLMPRVYQANSDKLYDIGIIPHYIDQQSFIRRFKRDSSASHVVLNIKSTNFERFIDKLCECRFVVSSSLHGLILAHAYNIPAVWIELSDQVIGRGFKFADYLLSVSIPFYNAVNLKSGEIKLSEMIAIKHNYRRFSKIINFNDAGLLNSLEHAIEHVDTVIREAQNYR